MSKKTRFYAYLIPHTPVRGVTAVWSECEQKVKGIESARFKGFSTREAAEQWLADGAQYHTREIFAPGVYFDAGTGRGNGVEVSVTDERWQTLLPLVLPKDKINRYGKHLLTREFTNNYGELLACSLAIQVALKTGIKSVYGDSALVINYWSKGAAKKDKNTEETLRLAHQTKKLREEFEAGGGTLTLISGSANPADLGFH